MPGRINIHYFLLIKSSVCNFLWRTANFAVLCWSVHLRQGRVPFSLWTSISSSSDNEAGDNQRLCTKTGGLLWSWPQNNDAFTEWIFDNFVALKQIQDKGVYRQSQGFVIKSKHTYYVGGSISIQNVGSNMYSCPFLRIFFLIKSPLNLTSKEYHETTLMCP